MRISSVKSQHYSELLCFLQEISDTQRGDVGYKSNGYLRQLSTFSMFFSLKMLYAVFARSESLAQALHSPKLSLANRLGLGVF